MTGRGPQKEESSFNAFWEGERWLNERSFKEAHGMVMKV